MKETIRSSKYTMKVDIWASICSEEIKNEKEMREFYKEKCNIIIKDYFNEVTQGDFSYFKDLANDENRKCVEYQLRFKYWNYFRVANLQLLNYSQFFKSKINLYSKKVNKKVEFNSNEKAQEDVRTKIYAYDLEKRLEENLRDLNELKIFIKKSKKNNNSFMSSDESEFLSDQDILDIKEKNKNNFMLKYESNDIKEDNKENNDDIE